MKPLSAALVALFETGSFVMADLYTFALAGGGTAYLTSADHDLIWNGATFVSTGPLVDRSAISQKLGLEVSQVKIDLYPAPGDLLLGMPWLQAMQLGLLDGAAVTIQRGFGATWSAGLAGTVTMMAGRVGDATIGRSKATLEVNSWTELLTNQMPREYYQSACRHVLFDAKCGLQAHAFQYDVAITGAVSPIGFYVDNLQSFPANWFAQGTIAVATGDGVTQSRSITASTAATEFGTYLQLTTPLTVEPVVGNIAYVFPGCDKTLATCGQKFANLSRFGGFPFIPAPEVAV